MLFAPTFMAFSNLGGALLFQYHIIDMIFVCANHGLTNKINNLHTHFHDAQCSTG